VTLDLVLDAADGAGVSWLYRNAEVLEKRADDAGHLWVTVRTDDAKAAQIRNKFRAASNR
jgi:GTP-binding protein HflX